MQRGLQGKFKRETEAGKGNGGAGADEKRQICTVFV